MRRCDKLAGVLALSLALAGCDKIEENRYFMRGIGTDVYTPDLADETFILEKCYGFICQQAGLSYMTDMDGDPRCPSYSSMGSREWHAFIKAGLNDIDRRCDAYLDWLHDKKRSREPWLKQITDTQTVTDAILNATGVGRTAMTVVVQAFGLLSKTVANTYSRLILEMEESSVRSVVHRLQNAYQDLIAKSEIRSKPDAYYAIRGYLRLCLPSSIEAEINNTVTLTAYRRGPDGRIERSMPRSTALKPSFSSFRASSPIPRTPKVQTAVKGAVGPYETSLEVGTVKNIQSKLCVTPTGTIGPKTRDAIRYYELTTVSTRNGFLDPAEVLQIESKTSCSRSKFRNYYERSLFEKYQDGVFVKKFQKALNAEKPQNPIPATGALDSQTRKKIREVTGSSDEITPELAARLSKHGLDDDF